MYRKHSNVIDTLLVAVAVVTAMIPAYYTGAAIATMRGFYMTGGPLGYVQYPVDATAPVASMVLPALAVWLTVSALTVWAGTKLAFAVSARLAR